MVRGMSDVAGRNAWLANLAALGTRGGSSGETAQTSDHHGMAAISRWTGNRYIHASMYLWHTIYAWHTCTCIHTHIHTYIHLYIYIHIVQIFTHNHVVTFKICTVVYLNVDYHHQEHFFGREWNDSHFQKYNGRGRGHEILNCLSSKNTDFWEIKTPKIFVQNPRKHLLRLVSDSQKNLPADAGKFFVIPSFPVPFQFP